ncbi:MAG: DUF6194 family protein [Pseudomonadota bacterium]
MNQRELTQLLEEKFPGLRRQAAYGEATFFYNPGNRFQRGTYFCTIKEQDGPNDTASNLSRNGVWRFNFGLPRFRYTELFGPPATRPAKGNVIAGAWDFHQLDRLMPHPVYGWMGWVCILNPSDKMIGTIWPEIERAHQKARQSFERRVSKET